MQKLQRNTAYWLAPHGLLSLPPYTIQDQQPRDGTIPSELGLPTSTIKQQSALQTDLQTTPMEVFFLLRVPLHKWL